MKTISISDSHKRSDIWVRNMTNENNSVVLNNKALFDFWHKEVRLKNLKTISSDKHITTPELRHECTNYDSLCIRPGVLALDDAQKNRVITIIKYECTAKVLQRRAGILNRRAKELEILFEEQKVYKNKLEEFIHVLKQRLFRKDDLIKQQEVKIKALEAKVKALETGNELEAIKQNYLNEKKRRESLANNNRKMGGRLSWANRWKEQRNKYLIELNETKAVIQKLEKELACYKEKEQNLLEEENQNKDI